MPAVTSGKCPYIAHVSKQWTAEFEGVLLEIALRWQRGFLDCQVGFSKWCFFIWRPSCFVVYCFVQRKITRRSPIYAWLSCQSFADLFSKGCNAAKWMRTWDFLGCESNFFQRRATVFRPIPWAFIYLCLSDMEARRYQHYLLQRRKMLILGVNYIFDTLGFIPEDCM